MKVRVKHFKLTPCPTVNGIVEKGGDSEERMDGGAWFRSEGASVRG